MRSSFRQITGVAVFFGVLLLNGLIYTTIIAPLNVSQGTRRAMGGVVLVCMLAMVWQVGRKIVKRRAAERRATFLSGRAALCDEEFLREMGLEDERERRVARVIRNAAAGAYGVPPEMLQPSDVLGSLDEALTSSIVLSLEPVRDAIKAEMRSDYDWWFEQGETMDGRGLIDVSTFGEFVQFYLKNLDRLTASKAAAHR